MSRAGKWDNVAADEANAARQVWCAVIQQAIDDANMRVAEIEPRHSTARRCELLNKARQRDEARSWLAGVQGFRHGVQFGRARPCRGQGAIKWRSNWKSRNG